MPWPQESDITQESRGPVISLTHPHFLPSPASTFCCKHRSLPWTHVCQMLLPLLAHFFFFSLLLTARFSQTSSQDLLPAFPSFLLTSVPCQFWFPLLLEGPLTSLWPLHPIFSLSLPTRPCRSNFTELTTRSSHNSFLLWLPWWSGGLSFSLFPGLPCHQLNMSVWYLALCSFYMVPSAPLSPSIQLILRSLYLLFVSWQKVGALWYNPSFFWALICSGRALTGQSLNVHDAPL